jgi:hypothetical protein
VSVCLSHLGGSSGCSVPEKGSEWVLGAGVDDESALTDGKPEIRIISEPRDSATPSSTSASSSHVFLVSFCHVFVLGT